VVPLLVESPDYRQRVQRVLVVDCPPPVQSARVSQRSGLPADEIERIIDAQLPRATRLAAADDVIDNSGSLDALHKQVQALHRRYLEQARAPA
jgi:dephospho-CoA kinase